MDLQHLLGPFIRSPRQAPVPLAGKPLLVGSATTARTESEMSGLGRRRWIRLTGPCKALPLRQPSDSTYHFMQRYRFNLLLQGPCPQIRGLATDGLPILCGAVTNPEYSGCRLSSGP